jgi:hypothetical protein
MGLFNFLKKKKGKELDNLLNEMTKVIFPNGQQDIDDGTNELLHILQNKVDKNTAKTILMRCSSICYTTGMRNEFNRERLKAHLAGYALQYFNENQLDRFYYYLLFKHIDIANDFYDKMFETLFSKKPYIMPQYGCIVSNKGIYVENKDNKEGLLAGHTYLWLRFVLKTNTQLHKHILALINDDKLFSNDDKKNFISSMFLGQSLDFFNDSNAVNEIFIRIRAYRNLIDRLMNELLSFYNEHGDNDVRYFLSRANQDFLPTSKITEIENLTIFDIDKIFVRDMASGKKLK